MLRAICGKPHRLVPAAKFATGQMPFGRRQRHLGGLLCSEVGIAVVAVQGRADNAIKSLFTDTLAGWRDSAAASQAELGSIATSLEGVFAHANVRKRYIKAAAGLGVARDPQDIWEGFLNLPLRSWPKAPIHGDLHGENVQVRGDDAIIIDSAKVTMGPPGADPACLEVWIAFKLPPTGYEVDEAAWLRTIQELFAYRQVVSPPDLDPTAPVGWLHDGIARKGTVALTSCQPFDYAITLALYLLRRATFDPDISGMKVDEHCRTWAWILGCQLLEAVQKIYVQYKEAA